MKETTYTVSELKNIIKESSLGLSPKMGKNVMQDNKSNNKDYYNNTKKKIEGYNKDANNETKKSDLGPKVDSNKTTMDYSFMNEPDKSFKDKVKSQTKGYTSSLEEKNGIEKAADFDNNSELYDNLKDLHDEYAKNSLAGKKSGLTARELPDSTFERDSMFENVKKLIFKHTKFLGEEHMLSRVPDEYKKDGIKIVMKDNDENEYLIEWHIDKERNISEGKVLKYRNKKHINEEMAKIKNLMTYKHSDYFNTTTSKMRENENKNVGKFIDEAKRITK